MAAEMITILLFCALCPPGVEEEVSKILPLDGEDFFYSTPPAKGNIIVHVEGPCWLPDRPVFKNALGWVSRIDDEGIRPEVHIDCPAVRGLVSSEIFMSRALGRVIAHELFHVITQTEEHSSGLMAKKFSRSALEAPKMELSFDDKALFVASLRNFHSSN